MFSLFKKTPKPTEVKQDTPDLFVAIPALIGIITDEYRQALDEYNDSKDRLGFSNVEPPKIVEMKKNKFINVSKFTVLSYLVDWSETNQEPLLIVNLYCEASDERVIENFLVSVSEWNEVYLPLFNGEYVDIDSN